MRSFWAWMGDWGPALRMNKNLTQTTCKALCMGCRGHGDGCMPG